MLAREGLDLRHLGREISGKEIKPADPAGVCDISVLPGADGRTYVDNYRRWIGSLYIIESLR